MRRFAILLLALTPALAHAWAPEGVRVCGAPGSQMAPLVCTDGSGGAFVVWQDYRAGGGAPLDVYLQRITGAGTIARGWPVDGVAIAIGPTVDYPHALIPDGSGGVLVLFGSYLNYMEEDIYLQRITADGQLAPGWPAGGGGLWQRPRVASSLPR